MNIIEELKEAADLLDSQEILGSRVLHLTWAQAEYLKIIEPGLFNGGGIEIIVDDVQ
jgi:hypothetical protein